MLGTNSLEPSETSDSILQPQHHTRTVKASTAFGLHWDLPVPVPKERATVKIGPHETPRASRLTPVKPPSHPPLVPANATEAMARLGKPATPIATKAVATDEETSAFHRRWQRSTATCAGTGAPSSAVNGPTKNAPPDRRLVGVGSCLPVAAGGHKGDHPRLRLRHGNKTRTAGGRRSCTFMVLSLFAATSLMMDVVHAVFTPADFDAVENAISSCLHENTTGYCPDFAASEANTTTGNLYGLMGDWDVSKVTRMNSSTFSSVFHTFC